MSRAGSGEPTQRNDLAPALTIEGRKITELRPASRQVRRANTAHIAEIKASMEQFGICVPLLITLDGEIIDGHARIETTKVLGMSEIQCLVVGHVSAADVRRLRVALNRIQEKGEWDLPALEVELTELNVEFDGDLFIPGIEPQILDGFLQSSLQMEEVLQQALVRGAAQVVTRRGDVWKLGPHVLACADARDIGFITHLLETLFGSNKVRLNFSNLPYNVAIQGHVTSGDHREFVMASGEMTDTEFKAFLVESLKAIFETLLDGGISMLFMDWRGLKTFLEAAEVAGFSLLNIVVWAKTNAGMGSLYRSQHEFVVVLKKGSAPHINNVELGKNGRYRSNVWTYPGASSLGSDARKHLKDHPTPKPVALLADAILDVTQRGDLVFDSFAGSGSALIASAKAGRIFCGTELDPGYCDVILRRWLEHSGETATLLETDETYEQMARRRASEVTDLRNGEAIPCSEFDGTVGAEAGRAEEV